MKTRLNITPPDRLMNPVASPEEAAWRSAVQPVDTAVQRVENRWGSLANLQRHGKPETVAKFAAAWWKLNAAIDAQDVAETATRAGVIVRGLAALEAEAGEPDLPAMVTFNQPGNEASHHVIVVGCNSDAQIVSKAFPSAKIYTAEEVALLLSSGLLKPLTAIKEVFPTATVSRAGPPRSKLAEDLNDSIPF
jgi:hypothetical protein